MRDAVPAAAPAAGHAAARPAAAAQPRTPELDGLRGAAILLVLSEHFIGDIVDPALGAWARVAGRVLVMGMTGVDLFFVLSGFLITGIVLDRTRRRGAFLRVFYLRRALRILPPYLGLMALCWIPIALGVANAGINGTIPLWRFLTFTQNFWMAAHDQWGPYGLSVTWSVAIEEQYYLVFPALILALPRRALPWFLLLVGAASAALRAAGVLVLHLNAFYGYVYTPSRLDGLAAGGIIAWAWRDVAARRWLAAHAAALRAAGAALAAGFVALAASDRDIAVQMPVWGHLYTTLFFSVLLLVTLCHLGAPRTAWLRAGWLRWVGRISYSLYLFHPLVLGGVLVAAGHASRTLHGARDAGLALFALVLVLVFCHLLYTRCERPLLAYGRRYTY